MNYQDLSKTEVEYLIDEWVIGKYAERDRAIMRRRLIDGVCYEPLAEEFDLSVAQVKRIIYKRQNQIFRHRK